jgi:hypothetical protein
MGGLCCRPTVLLSFTSLKESLINVFYSLSISTPTSIFFTLSFYDALEKVLLARYLFFDAPQIG